MALIDKIKQDELRKQLADPHINARELLEWLEERRRALIDKISVSSPSSEKRVVIEATGEYKAIIAYVREKAGIAE